ncbi:hypothetical protein E4H04_11130 [Candidatus Bathyarchaeota archaeon]|nr:hypothetical protein [Candidatus Bathyarchaeota archaeon]TFH13932.1 MAG: hypothetical protein E4H04_11130 [Candidatus Bathyarchaeota archaeon]
MSNEQETKKLLGFRESMGQRILELEQEMKDLQKAMEEIDKLIVNTGFRTFTTADTLVQNKSVKPQKESVSAPIPEAELEDLMNITSKDGTILGTVQVEEHTIVFTPAVTFEFTVDIPPFQSFLIDRVLENMRKTDQERSTNGELDPDEILEYSVEDQDGKISLLIIKNYGGERRLREINSSLRWTLDKMYDKLTQG